MLKKDKYVFWVLSKKKKKIYSNKSIFTDEFVFMIFFFCKTKTRQGDHDDAQQLTVLSIYIIKWNIDSTFQRKRWNQLFLKDPLKYLINRQAQLRAVVDRLDRLNSTSE